MTKFKVDINKGLYEQTWWNLLKPEVKLKAIKHWKDTDKIVDEKISKGEDLFERNIKYKVIDINENFPKYITDNLDKFKNWIA